jgi:phenylpyruvate tautomerase PptA (4-oxalocrotonate tautomerase family)
MPLVRVDLIKRPDPAFVHTVGTVVYESMRSAIGVPEHDNFQVLCEHDAKQVVFDASYLGIERTPSVVFIQITLNEGRTMVQKKLLYKTIADTLKQRLGVRPEDVLINLVEVKKENWSFGNGVAQYAG